MMFARLLTNALSYMGLNRPLHIVMFGAGNPPATFISRQIDALHEAGVEVTIYPYTQQPHWRSKLLFKTGLPALLPAADRASLRSADVLHFQWLTDYLNFRQIAQRMRRPTVVSLRGRQINVVPHMPGRETYRHKLKRYLRDCHGYHGVSQATIYKAVEFGINPSRALAIYTPIDVDFFKPPVEPPPDAFPLQLVMVGALIWRKGFEYALDTLAQVIAARPGAVRMVIIGDGVERERIAYTAQDLGISASVKILGRLNKEGVRAVLHGSHIFLHTSLSEGLANVVVEAMACGLPVVTTDTGGMTEAVTDGIEGFVTPTRDPRAMASAIIRLIDSPDQRHAMGLAGRQRVLHQFTMTKHANDLLTLYRNAIQEAGYA